MKVFEIRAEFDEKGFSIYKNFRPFGYKNWVTQSIADIETGKPLSMMWDEHSRAQNEGDFILFPLLGVASKAETIGKISPLAPHSRIIPLKVAKSSGDYAFIDPQNYIEPAPNMDHLFLMFRSFKAPLVTEVFKSAWESFQLTGATFEYATDIDSDLFLKW